MWRGALPLGEGADSIGLSFFVHHAGTTRYIGHTGSQKSFQSFFYIDPVGRTAAIAAFNTVGEAGKPPDTRRILNDLRATVWSNVLPALSAHRRVRADSTPDAPQPPALQARTRYQ
jgi:hypothetical protein